MIQLSDTSVLSSIGDELASLISINSQNWDDQVFDRIEKEQLAPIESKCCQIATSAESKIQIIANTYNEMSILAMKY